MHDACTLAQKKQARLNLTAAPAEQNKCAARPAMLITLDRPMVDQNLQIAIADASVPVAVRADGESLVASACSPRVQQFLQVVIADLPVAAVVAGA
jgi:hypothetical protein